MRQTTEANSTISRSLRIVCVFGLAVMNVAACVVTRGQGVATGGTAVSARPLPPGMRAPAVNYEDIAAKAGLVGVNVSGAERAKQYIVETTGTGVAILDYDNDGLPDIFFVNAGKLGSSGTETKHFLYHNLGGLKFEDVTEKAGLSHTGWGQGVCAGDFDDDGNVDLFVTQWGQNVLYHNLGQGHFRDETLDRGLLQPKDRWSTGCAFIDFDRDGHLDLLVVHYVDFDLAHTPRPGDHSECKWKGMSVLCGPRGLPAETVSLYRNDGHGKFTDVSDSVHIAGPKNCYGFTTLVSDFDEDGWPDIYVACDSTPNLYYHNVIGKTFEQMGAEAGVAYNEDGREQAGMGLAAGDYDGDGRLDIFKTNFADDTHTLYRNLGGNNFADATIASGLAVNTKYLGWGTAFLDIDNDGRKDLIVANGHVYPEVDSGRTEEKFKQKRLLYWNRGDGQFFDLSDAAGTGISSEHSSRGLAVADLDNEGEQEIVVVNIGESPSLLKNTGPKLGNSLLLRLLTATGRDAIGARATVVVGERKQVDEVRSGGSFISQNDFRLHFGLGKAESAQVSIRWPDGKSETLPSLPQGEIVTIQEGKGVVSRKKFNQTRAKKDDFKGAAPAP